MGDTPKYVQGSWKTQTTISKYKYKICSKIMENMDTNFKIQILKYVPGSWVTISKYKYKSCSRILVNMGSKYKAGVPELGLPAIDPLVVRRKNFSFPAMRKCLDSSDA